MGGSSRKTHRTKEMMERSEFFAKLRDDRWRRECDRKKQMFDTRRLVYESILDNSGFYR